MNRAAARSNVTTIVSAAELIVLRARARLERRIAWLAAADGEDLPEREQVWAQSHSAGDDTAAQRLAGAEGQGWSRLIELFRLSPAKPNCCSLRSRSPSNLRSARWLRARSRRKAGCCRPSRW